VNNWKWLCKLYYEIGKQKTDFELQIAWKDEHGEQMWSRRKSFLMLHTLEEPEWIQRANNRTFLKNEIVLDYDRIIPPEKVMKDPQILAAQTWCNREGHQYSIFHTGSKGVHFHIYIDFLSKMKVKNRKEYREKVISLLCGDQALIPNFSGDYAKISDNVPIALEFCPHWKTGKPKRLMYSNFLKVEDVED